MGAPFANAKEATKTKQEVPVEKLYAQISQLNVELDIFKISAKIWGFPRRNGSHKAKMPPCYRVDNASYYRHPEVP
jgi:hypothetical protein